MLSGLSRENKKFMLQVRKKLDNIVNLYIEACGRDEDLEIAARAFVGLEFFIKEKIESLQEEIVDTEKPYLVGRGE